MNAPAKIERTPTGRVRGAPLRNRRHEAVCWHLARGATQEAACREAGALDPNGSSFAPNARRLCQRPEIRERAEEITRMEAESIGIYAAWWLLSDVKLFARSSLSVFYQFDDRGRVVVDQYGNPILDFTGASKEQLRTIKKMKPTKEGVEYEVHDPLPYIDRMGRVLGLWNSDGAVAVASANAGAMAEVKDVSARELIASRIARLAAPSAAPSDT